MVTWRVVPHLKPFRALRYDPGTVGPLDAVVCPPHDVITPDRREPLLTASPHNAVRLLSPESPAEAARLLRAWQAGGALIREDEPAVWVLEETFSGVDGGTRYRRGIVARVELTPYSAGEVVPHERTFEHQKQARLELLRAVRTKLSPIFLVHEGPSPEIPRREPDLEATLDGMTSRLWRVVGAEEIQSAIAGVHGRLLIADGHHRYETALAFHQTDLSEETGYVLAALISRTDSGLEILPTHRLVSGAVPELDGSFRLTEVEPSGEAGTAALARIARDHPAFVLLQRDSAVLAEGDGRDLDTAVIDRLLAGDVRYTPSAVAAEEAVRSGRARAAFLVRAPTLAQVEEVARSGERLPQKTTYFFPKLTSGLLFQPLDAGG
jgi:uncharacterized protein (DUF1015 family)